MRRRAPAPWRSSDVARRNLRQTRSTAGASMCLPRNLEGRDRAAATLTAAAAMCLPQTYWAALGVGWWAAAVSGCVGGACPLENGERSTNLPHAGGLHVTLETDHGLPGSRSRRRLRRLRRLRRTGAPRQQRAPRRRAEHRSQRGWEPEPEPTVRTVVGPAELPVKDFDASPSRRRRPSNSGRSGRLGRADPTQPESVDIATGAAQRSGRLHGAVNRSAPSIRPGPGGRRQVQGGPAGHHEPRGHRTRGGPPTHRLRERHLLRPRRLDGEGGDRRLPPEAADGGSSAALRRRR